MRFELPYSAVESGRITSTNATFAGVERRDINHTKATFGAVEAQKVPVQANTSTECVVESEKRAPQKFGKQSA